MSENIKNDFNDSTYIQYLNSYNDFSDVTVENYTEYTAKKESEKLKNKLVVFKDIHTVAEAKYLAKKMFDIKHEFNFIKAGNSHCTIINRAKTLRIIFDSEEELICYNFGIMEENK